MTVSTEISSNEYTGNGVTTDFDYKFRIFKENQLSVITSDADGDNVVTLRLGTDYTVTGANKSAGGKVILTKPLANGHKISIARDIPIKQETSFRNQGKFFAETHEDAFDYLTMIIQRIWGSLGSLYLKRPNILANWFDAKGYRIANLGKPKRDSDAVDLGTLNDEIEGVSSTILKREKRLLRVDDMDISALPKAVMRANKLLAFDELGFPMLVLPESGSAADVLIELAKPTGASLVGGSALCFGSLRDAISSSHLSKEKLLIIEGYNYSGDGGYSIFRVVDKDVSFGIITNSNQFKLQRVSGHDWLHRIIRNGQTPRIVAHRGWSSISPGEAAGDNQIVNFVPENTKEAIRFCAERGAFGIEGDTKISKDGVPVIFHDYNLSRVTKGVHNGAIESYTYDELRAMDVGSYVSAKYKDARIMNYDEWLGECKRCSIMPVAEWSAPMTEQQANDLISTIKKYYGEQHSDVFVSSTYPETLKLLRRKSAYLGLGVMGGYGTPIDEGRWALAYELGNSAIHLNGKSVLNMTEVNKAKEMGLLIFTGIPNSAGRIEQCVQAGVDVIVPDFYRG
ncbi:glycerophosphodiester phosphodiesterase family protein [Providencia vermicola]|uniref:glycerophosphodiester phosphodiesterase family protein n=1 Tax=Providencia vermicola TaxID=333965 RepID=UPI0032DB5582